MKRLKAPPVEIAAGRGTQITALRVLPGSRSSSLSGPLAPFALAPPEPNATASATMQTHILAGLHRVFILIRWSPRAPLGQLFSAGLGRRPAAVDLLRSPSIVAAIAVVCHVDSWGSARRRNARTS